MARVTAPSSSATSARTTASSGISAKLLHVRDHGGAALGEHAQQRGRGLARGGIAEVHDDVRGFHVRGQRGQRNAAGDDRPLAHPEATRPASRPAVRGSATGPTSSKRSDGEVHRRPRNRPRRGLDPLLAGEQAEAADHEARRRDPQARRARRPRPRPPPRAPPASAGEPRPARPASRRRSRAPWPRCARPRARDTATGKRNSGYAYGSRSPMVFRCAATTRLRRAGIGWPPPPPCTPPRPRGGVAQRRAGGIGRVRARGLGVQEHGRPRVVQDEVVEDEQPGDLRQRAGRRTRARGRSPSGGWRDRTAARGGDRRATTPGCTPTRRGDARRGPPPVVMEDVDLVTAGQQREHLGRVVGDARRRGGSGEQKARRATTVGR